MLSSAPAGSWHLLLLTVVLLATLNAVNGFGLGPKDTKCNLDPSKGDVNDPCASLYNGVCGGKYCKCTADMHVDDALKSCVPGAPKAKPSGGVDLFDDLPFDYVPPGDRNGDGGATKPAVQPPPQPPPQIPPQPQPQPQPRPPPQPGYNPNQPQPGYNPNQPQPGYNPNQPGVKPTQPGAYNPNQPGYKGGSKKTSSGPVCQFPFIFKGKSYSNCTEAESKGKPWCSTETDRKNKYIEGKWKYCGASDYNKEVGGGVGGLLGFGLFIGIIYFCCCRGEKGKETRQKFQGLPFANRSNNQNMAMQQPDGTLDGQITQQDPNFASQHSYVPPGGVQQAPPPAGGYAPVPQQPGYAPPPQPGYGAPPQGYAPGYAPPPQPGYAPPPQPGYAMPPQGYPGQQPPPAYTQQYQPQVPQ